MIYTSEQIDYIDALVKKWLSVDINPDSRNEILDLQKKKDYKTLDGKLSNRISFGTAGLRSSMSSGFAHMNDVTILQASQGLVKYLINNSPENKQLSIVIGYDHRYKSQRFAEITASVAITQGFKVYYLGTIINLSEESIRLSATKVCSPKVSDRHYVHTPLVPFAIDYFEASAGIMVTASHNPAQDNGYKVYYSNGCQIIPPHDVGISESINENLDPWTTDDVWNVTSNFQKGIEQNLLVSVKDETTKEYIKQINTKIVKQSQLNLKFVYTPLHGIGLEIFEKVLKLFNGYKFTTVAEQSKPDPSFSTVRFPNPEEKGALAMSIKAADSLGYNLVLANDPDADRFSVAIKKNGEWRQLTGNEIGFLFAMYVIEQTPKEVLSNTYLLNSTVSSQVLQSMAQIERFKFQDTLTGFKWIGNKAVDLKKAGYSVPYGYEEAIGFMFDIVNDKDGIAAAAVWLQLYQLWFAKGEIDPIDKLYEGYEKYGWFKEYNGYYKVDNLCKTKEIFDAVRNSFEGSYPHTIGKFKVLTWRDLTIGYDSSTTDKKPILPADSTSQMITATLVDAHKNEVRFTCRGSGTEPKLKVYIEGKSSSELGAVKVAKDLWNTLKVNWFKPDLNDLLEVI